MKVILSVLFVIFLLPFSVNAQIDSISVDNLSVSSISFSHIAAIIGFIAAIITSLVGLITIFRGIRSNYRKWRSKSFRVNFLLTSGSLNERIAKTDFREAEETYQLSGRFLYDIYGTSQMRKMTIRDVNGRREIIIPYQEMINFISNPKAKIEIDPKNVSNADVKTEQELINALLSPELVSATEPVLKEVLKSKPKTFNGAHPRLKEFEKKSNDLYRCSLEKTCYFAQIRTNLSLDYPITVKGVDTSMREIEMGGRKTFVDFKESRLANVIGVSAIWCLDGKDTNSPKDRRFYLLPRVNEVGVYANRLGTPAGDIECPKDGIFIDDNLVDFLKWEIAREFFEETGVASDLYEPEKCFERIKMEVLDDKKEGNSPRKNKCLYKSKKFEIIPLAFMRETLRGGKPMMFFLIRTEWIDERVLYKCFKKSLGKLEFRKSLFSSAYLSTEATCNYLYAQAFLQQKPKPGDCIDLSRGAEVED
ncbi:MAG: hypothetical protein IJR01_00335 [Bacteroidales bacterium]|nr:hypothetical protein [Bacteroidales bacterium]